MISIISNAVKSRKLVLAERAAEQTTKIGTTETIVRHVGAYRGIAGTAGEAQPASGNERFCSALASFLASETLARATGLPR